MPTSEKQRKAAFAELQQRRKGGKKRGFSDMDTDDLDAYARSPLHKKKKGKDKDGKKGKGKFSAQDQADALAAMK